MQNQEYSNLELTTDGSTLDLTRALSADVTKDPGCLLGRRFLCRGGGGFIFGQSSIGKSSFVFQMACHLATGQDFFGIGNRDGHPLRLLLVQAENDERELAEVLQSVTASWPAPLIELLKKNLMVRTHWDKSGQEFATWLGDRANEHAADLVIVDPLMAYLGDDAGNNQAVSQFLRSYINRILKSPQSARPFGLLFVHHTGKPTNGSKPSDERNAAAKMYNMLGASELVNWARCIMRLESDAVNGRFLFSVPKRGDRSGMRLLGSGEWGCYVKHSPREASGKPVLKWLAAENGPFRPDPIMGSATTTPPKPPRERSAPVSRTAKTLGAVPKQQEPNSKPPTP